MCLCSVLFPHIRSRPNFGTNSGDDAQSVLLQDAKKKRSLAQRTQLRGDSHTRVGKKTKNKKNYPVEQIKAKKKTKKKQASNLDPLSFLSAFLSVLKPALSQQLVSAQPLVSPLRTPHGLCYGAAYSCIGSSTEVVGLPSAMRPLPIINGKEERREKGEGRLVAALATALPSATARF